MCVSREWYVGPALQLLPSYLLVLLARTWRAGPTRELYDLSEY